MQVFLLPIASKSCAKGKIAGGTHRGNLDKYFGIFVRGAVSFHSNFYVSKKNIVLYCNTISCPFMWVEFGFARTFYILYFLFWLNVEQDGF